LQPAPRLLAISADGSQQVGLGLIGQPKQTAERLKGLLQSDLLGLVGHCDGLVMGAIRGWACRRGQQRPAQIWLQANGQEPIPIPCNGHRDGLQAMNLPSQSGFVLDPETLPQAWSGLEVWCSFDRETQFRLPQQAPIVLPSRAVASGGLLQPEPNGPEPSAMPMASNYQAMLQAAPEDLQQHWQALEEFRAYLDSVEQQLAQEQQRRHDLANQNPKPSGAARRRRWRL